MKTVTFGTSSNVHLVLWGSGENKRRLAEQKTSGTVENWVCAADVGVQQETRAQLPIRLIRNFHINLSCRPKATFQHFAPRSLNSLVEFNAHRLTRDRLNYPSHDFRLNEDRFLSYKLCLTAIYTLLHFSLFPFSTNLLFYRGIFTMLNTNTCNTNVQNKTNCVLSQTICLCDMWR